MGNVIVAALLIVGAGAAATIVVITQGPSLTTGIDSVFQSQRAAADRIRSHIDIVGVSANDSRMSIDVWLKNTGDVPIDAVSNIDLILKREGPGGGAYITHGASTGNRWSVVAPVTEVVNPGETLHVRIMLDEPVASGVHNIRVNTPRGSVARETFEIATTPTPPSNQLIAFTSFRDGNAEIYSMKEDGSDLTRLTVNQAGDWRPAWSPSGDKIAFQSDRDGNLEIYVMDADGSGQTRLTQNTYQDEAPTWSRDGSQIAFQSNAGDGGNYEIFVMDSADGANRFPLTESGSDVWQTDVWQNESPRWSPQSVPGDLISFSSYRSQRDSYIIQLVTPQPGSTPLPARKLTDLPTDDGPASWSSDGVLMVLESRRSGNLEIYTVNLDGTNPIRLTHDPGNDRSPSWSRDTSRIVFESDRAGNRDIYLMDSDGTNLKRLTRHSAHDESPAWAWGPD